MRCLCFSCVFVVLDVPVSCSQILAVYLFSFFLQCKKVLEEQNGGGLSDGWWFVERERERKREREIKSKDRSSHSPIISNNPFQPLVERQEYQETPLKRGPLLGISVGLQRAKPARGARQMVNTSELRVSDSKFSSHVQIKKVR